MEARAREVRNYIAPNGRNPFEQWLGQIRDKRTQLTIATRIERLQQGNPGDFKSLKGNLYELRIHYGPGYRVYFGVVSSEDTVILLCGGTKRTQKRDIEKAQNYWNEFRNSTYE